MNHNETKIEVRNAMVRPTHYTSREGGDWVAWVVWGDNRYDHIPIASIRFSDDTIFDLAVGKWRAWSDPEETARKAFAAQLEHELRVRKCLLPSSTIVNCSEEALQRTIFAALDAKNLKLHK